MGLNGISLPAWVPFSADLAAWLPDYFEVRSLLHQYVAAGGAYPLLAIPVGLAIAVLCPNIYQWLDRFQPAMYYEPRPVDERWRLSWQPSVPVGLILAAATTLTLIFAGRPLTYIYWQF